MKSLRSAGRAVAVARRGQEFRRALKGGRVGQHRQAGGAAGLVGRASAGGSKSARIRPFDGLAFLISAISAKSPRGELAAMAAAKPRGGDCRLRQRFERRERHCAPSPPRSPRACRLRSSAGCRPCGVTRSRLRPAGRGAPCAPPPDRCDLRASATPPSGPAPRRRRPAPPPR